MPPGIFDLRFLYPVNNNASEGNMLRQALRACVYMLKKADAYFKVAMASNLASRWEMYRDIEDPHKFKPSHLCIVMDFEGRVAVGMAEAALIFMLSESDFPTCYNVNHMNNDRGGTGPRKSNGKHYVYLALKPVGK